MAGGARRYPLLLASVLVACTRPFLHTHPEPLPANLESCADLPPITVSRATSNGLAVDLAWTLETALAEAWIIERNVNAAGWDQVTELPGDARSYATALPADATTRFRMSARVGTCVFPAVETAGMLGRPTAPEDFAAVAAAADSITLAWRKTSVTKTSDVLERRPIGASQFEQRNIDATACDLPGVSTDLSCFRDTGLAANTEYEYRLSAVNAAGTSEAIDASQWTAPLPLVGLSVATVSKTQLHLSWTSGQDGEIIIRRRVSGGPITDLATQDGSPPSFDDVTLSAGQTAEYLVTRRNQGGLESTPVSASDRTIFDTEVRFAGSPSMLGCTITVPYTATIDTAKGVSQEDSWFIYDQVPPLLSPEIGDSAITIEISDSSSETPLFSTEMNVKDTLGVVASVTRNLQLAAAKTSLLAFPLVRASGASQEGLQFVGGNLCVSIASDRLASVAAGNNFSAFLSRNGEVLFAGFPLASAFDCSASPEACYQARPLRRYDGIYSAIFRGAVALSAGPGFLCALREDQTLFCTGSNDDWQLGSGNVASSPDHFVHVCETGSDYDSNCVPLSGVVAVAAGGAFTCALRTSGRVWCWGANEFGQAGTGSAGADVFYPTEVCPGSGGSCGDMEDIVGIAAGQHHACAVRGDGRVLCWGRNQFGQLGNGTAGSDPIVTPTVVMDCVQTGLDDATCTGPASPLSGVIGLATGPEHTCAIIENGTAKCWGKSDWGILADGRPMPNFGLTPHPRPSTVCASGTWDGSACAGGEPLNGIVVMSAGYANTCAVTVANGNRGEAWCWGYGGQGELGNGLLAHASLPQALLAPPAENDDPVYDVLAISVGLEHSCVLRATKPAFCWGKSDATDYRLANTALGYVSRGVYAQAPEPIAPFDPENIPNLATGGFFYVITCVNPAECD